MYLYLSYKILRAILFKYTFSVASVCQPAHWFSHREVNESSTYH